MLWIMASFRQRVFWGGLLQGSETRYPDFERVARNLILSHNWEPYANVENLYP